jgi:hypothetical protein
VPGTIPSVEVVTLVAALVAGGGTVVLIFQNFLRGRAETGRALRQVQPIVAITQTKEVDVQHPKLSVTMTSIGGQAPTSLIAFRFGNRIYRGSPALPPHFAGTLSCKLDLIGELPDSGDADHVRAQTPSEHLYLLVRDVEGRWWDGTFGRVMGRPKVALVTPQAIYAWSRDHMAEIQEEMRRKRWWRRALAKGSPGRRRPPK